MGNPPLPPCRHQIRAAGKTKNTATKLDSTPLSSIKPVASHPEAKAKASKQLDKRARDDRDKVLNSIFQAFHAHQFYAFRDLVQITKQPPVSCVLYHNYSIPVVQWIVVHLLLPNSKTTI